VCRAPFGAFAVVPLLSDDPRAWFRCVDFDGKGRLTREEVTEVLATHFPLDRSKLEVALPQLWPSWDIGGAGAVTEDDFFAPGGLLDFARAHLLPAIGRPPPSPTSAGGSHAESLSCRRTDPHDATAAYPPAERGFPPAQTRQLSGGPERVAPVPPAATQAAPPSPSRLGGRVPSRTSPVDAVQATLPPAVPLPEARTMPQEVDRV